jgi:hypothetical protein
MSRLLFIIFLLFGCSLSVQAQDAIKISELTPCPTPPKLTKSELKRSKQFAKDVIHIYDFKTLKTFVGIEPVALSNGKKASLIKSQMNSYEVSFMEMNDGKFQGEFNFFIRITSINKKFDGCFEERRNFNLKKEDIGKKVWLKYNKVFELPKDIYIITFFVRDIQIGVNGLEKIRFEVN